MIVDTLKALSEDGLKLHITCNRDIGYSGTQAVVKKWLDTLKAHKPALIAALNAQVLKNVNGILLAEIPVDRKFNLPTISEAQAEDRIQCTACDHLSGAVCQVARPGGIVSAIRDHRPDTQRMHRCNGFQPKPDQPDQRPAQARWPHLI